MDKKGWTIIVICVLGILGNNWYSTRKADEWRKQQEILAKNNPPAAPTPGTADAPAPTPSDPNKPGQLEVTPAAPKFAEKETVIEVPDSNPKQRARYIFTNRGGGIKRVEFPGDEVHAKTTDIVKMNDALARSIGALSDGVDRVEEGEYQLISATADTVVYEGQTYNGLIATKTYKAQPTEPRGLPCMQLTISLRNPGATEINTSGWFLYSGSAIPLLADEVEAQTGIAWQDGNKAGFEAETNFKGGMFSSAKAMLQQDLGDAKWFGAINQYYAVLVAPATAGKRTWWAMPVEASVPGRKSGEMKDRIGVQTALGLGAGVFAPGESKEQQWTIFAGPKDFDALKKTGPGFEQVLLYSNMPIFGWMAGPFSKLLNWGLHRIKTAVPDFGIAIIILTIILRTLIWPLHAKSQRTMKRMSLLNPIQQELRTKYENDPQKLNQEVMKLYRDYGINPLGGCLPMFLQMPIFFGFYRMLQYAAELRHENFLWVKDLSQPDTLFHVAGIPVNILPLLMAVTMVLQMKMTPMTGDKMQQRIFQFMPLIFLVICYNFAAALSLYWTTQNIFAIGQSWYMKRQPDVTLEKRKPKARGAGLDNDRRRMMGLPPEKDKKSGKPRPPRTGG